MDKLVHAPLSIVRRLSFIGGFVIVSSLQAILMVLEQIRMHTVFLHNKFVKSSLCYMLCILTSQDLRRDCNKGCEDSYGLRFHLPTGFMNPLTEFSYSECR